jgi:hypothetical protein
MFKLIKTAPLSDFTNCRNLGKSENRKFGYDELSWVAELEIAFWSEAALNDEPAFCVKYKGEGITRIRTSMREQLSAAQFW